MSKAIENAVIKATDGIISEMGFELAQVRYAREADVDGWVLTIFIYHPDGITIDDCEKVSIAVDPVVEQIDLLQEAYFLSVSSLGLDRPFNTTRDYERYLNKSIEIKFFAAINLQEFSQEPIENAKTNKSKKKKSSAKKKEFIGTLRSADEDTIVIEIDGNGYVFPRPMIAKACPAITW